MPTYDHIIAKATAAPWVIEPTHGDRVVDILNARFAGAGPTADDLRAAEASHRLYVPLATDVAAGDTWTSAGRVYDVVYAPAPTAVDVDRLVGLKEIR